MKVNYSVKEMPSCVSYIVCGNTRQMIEDIEKSGEVDFYIHRQTKTSLNVSIQSGENSFVIGHIPHGAEKFKFLTQTSYSFLDYKQHERNYFKITKKQGLNELKEYLFYVLKEINFNREELTANIYIDKQVTL